MASLIPINYPPVKDPAIASFDFGDIASGQAIEVFQGGSQLKTTTKTFLLSPNAFYSQNIQNTVTISPSTNSFTKILDSDFDVRIDLPREIEGNSILNTTLFVKAISTTTQAYIIAKVRHWDGTTETELVNGQSSTVNWSSGLSADTAEQMVCVQLNIPRTRFAIGNTLRLTIEVWGKNTHVGNSATTGYGIDPKVRTGTYGTDPTELNFHVPFVVDI